MMSWGEKLRAEIKASGEITPMIVKIQKEVEKTQEVRIDHVSNSKLGKIQNEVQKTSRALFLRLLCFSSLRWWVFVVKK